jgi:hypothetical protein
MSAFAKFKTDFKKSYRSTEEEIYRKSVFLNNLAKIEAHNSDKSNTHSLGVNQFADLIEE